MLWLPNRGEEDKPTVVTAYEGWMRQTRRSANNGSGFMCALVCHVDEEENNLFLSLPGNPLPEEK